MKHNKGLSKNFHLQNNNHQGSMFYQMLQLSSISSLSEEQVSRMVELCSEYYDLSNVKVLLEYKDLILETISNCIKKVVDHSCYMREQLKEDYLINVMKLFNCGDFTGQLPFCP